MASVMTVLGPVAPEDLGFTHIHEHLALSLAPHDPSIAPIDDWDLAIEELGYFRRAGGQTVVELTPIGARVDAPSRKHGEALQHVSRTLGVHVVAGTSFMYEPSFPQQYREYTADELAEVMIGELNVGLQGTNARAGIIGEIGTGGGEWFSPLEERLLQASAMAHKATGAVVYTHTFAGRLGLKQVRVLESAGVDPSRIIIGHLDSGESPAADWPYHIEIARTGAYVAYDEVGRLGDSAWSRFYFPSDEQRVRGVVELVVAGFLRQILLSQDVCRKFRLHRHGGTGYDHLPCSFVPMLLDAGLSQAEVDTIMVENPRRVLTLG